MFYHADTNTYIREGVAFVIDGVQYSADWLNKTTPAEKAAHGITECTYEGVALDDKYHFNTVEYDKGVVRTVSTRKPQEMIDAMLRSIAVDAARKFLADTDWYVVRNAETGKEIPPEVRDGRAEARTLLSSE